MMVVDWNGINRRAASAWREGAGPDCDCDAASARAAPQ